MIKVWCTVPVFSCVGASSVSMGPGAGDSPVHDSRKGLRDGWQRVRRGGELEEVGVSGLEVSWTGSQVIARVTEVGLRS